MKKSLFSLFAVAAFALTSFNINALTLENYDQEESTYYFSLIATELPSPNINTVKVNITVENGEVVNLDELSEENVIFTSGDCGDDEFYTAKNICFTLLYSTPIVEGTVLADFSVERMSEDLTMRIKIGGDSAYSDGSTSYKLEETLYEDIILEDEENGIIELEITPEELSGEVEQIPESPSEEQTPNQAIDTSSDNVTVVLTVILGVLLLLTLLALLYFVLKPKTSVKSNIA